MDPPGEGGVRPADVARIGDEEGSADARPGDAVVRELGGGGCLGPQRRWRARGGARRAAGSKCSSARTGSSCSATGSATEGRLTLSLRASRRVTRSPGRATLVTELRAPRANDRRRCSPRRRAGELEDARVLGDGVQEPPPGESSSAIVRARARTRSCARRRSLSRAASVSPAATSASAMLQPNGGLAGGGSSPAASRATTWLAARWRGRPGSCRPPRCARCRTARASPRIAFELARRGHGVARLALRLGGVPEEGEDVRPVAAGDRGQAGGSSAPGATRPPWRARRRLPRASRTSRASARAALAPCPRRCRMPMRSATARAPRS